jgi:hypothetical protein
VAAHRRAVQQDRRGDREHHHHQHRVGYAGEHDVGEPVGGDPLDAQQRAVAELGEAFAQPADGLRVGELQRDAARDEHHPQRRDERRQLEPGDAQAVDRAAHHADRDPAEHAERHRHAGLHRQRGDHARQREDGADREVDAAGDDHAGGADPEIGNRGDLQRDGHRVADREERVAYPREHDRQREQAGERREPLEQVAHPFGHDACPGA